ncbi:Histone-lysine N-methyltransferase SETMAR [Eumeta japonica]|uniref:Histone-lysine N-methyltransferase SETMAR n=1 Tax=Eumeta variegata TaxID=151549 RepID=A0A4C1WGB0_EUMVA|nr:Histone-lysine N-methyltransferase SETMAR [Eumeta japonica]
MRCIFLRGDGRAGAARRRRGRELTPRHLRQKARARSAQPLSEVLDDKRLLNTCPHKLLRKERKNAQRNFEDMVSVLQESAPSYTMVKNGLAYFNKDESCEDDPPRASCDGSNGGKCSKIEKLVLADRRIKLWQIAEELQISKERVGEIIHEHMNMRKSVRVDEIRDRIVTVDETWVRQYDPESKQESMQWTKKGDRPPKKFKVQKSASKLMATIFWDSEGVLLIDYLPKGTTMNGQYYEFIGSGTRDSRTEATWEVIARCCVLQDNASVHTARVSRQALKDTGFRKLTTHSTAQI